ncbi:MAG TPA: hypothetical protein VF516_47945 [Kofleriaceae bacterium]
MAKIELPEGWAGVAEPLRALLAEIDREAHADGATPPDLAAMSAQWAQVSDAIRAAVRARIADAQVAKKRASKR